ncbi:hypothetical protein IFM89_024488 [Coptis chinensis]|uniref:CRAL/TRIO N-terminal domain-containing protein n=1 Tax=Coptis chinensis TaxID=261450 RepID=A0A835H5M0_9MAGN|nr:hypothetical protein IFM89_024488 [Coptis chinensis]
MGETVVAVAKEEEEEAKTKTFVETKEEETTPIVVEEEQVPPEEVFTWGIPLIGDEKSDTILLKFLRACDFKVKDTFTMVKNTVLWRKEFGIEGLHDEDLGTDLEKVVFMNGFDKEGLPVCYNVYGEFQNKELYQKSFSDEEKSGICTIVQVNDLKNSPGPLKTELRHATNKALSILRNYPEFVAKQVFIRPNQSSFQAWFKSEQPLFSQMDDSILIDEVGEKEEYGSVPESFAAPSVAFSSSVQPPEFEVEVEIVKPPCLGMCFETLEAAKQFYIDYGKSFGFSPVIRSSEKSVSCSDEVQGVSSCSSPEVRYKVENSSPETTKYLALRMYDSLKKHGLRNEVVMTLGGDAIEAEELKEVELGGSKKVEELMGMEYLLKDGFVSYLH